MLIKYCTQCKGNRYTRNLDTERCPYCNTALGIKSVDESELLDYEEFFGSDNNNEPANDEPSYAESNVDLPIVPYKDNGIIPAGDSATECARFSVSSQSGSMKRKGNSYIRGRVMQYSNTQQENSNYRRYLHQKIYDAIVYRQRMEDVLHRFHVRIDQGPDAFGSTSYDDVPVNVHGTIAGGTTIATNEEVEVEGQYRNGVLMASKINVINNGCSSEIKFQRSVRTIVYGILAVVAVIAMIVFVAQNGGGFFANIKSFLLTWLAFAVAAAVLYFVIFFSKIGFMARLASGKRSRFPFVGILFVSFVASLLFLNSFGIGVTLGSLISHLLWSILPAVLIIVILIVVLKCLLHF